VRFLALAASISLAGTGLCGQATSGSSPQNSLKTPQGSLKTMSLEQLGEVEVTTFSKAPRPRSMVDLPWKF
jgi:hypothetical protein